MGLRQTLRKGPQNYTLKLLRGHLRNICFSNLCFILKNILLSSKLITWGSRVVCELFNKTCKNLVETLKGDPSASLKKAGPRWPHRSLPVISTPGQADQAHQFIVVRIFIVLNAKPCGPNTQFIFAKEKSKWLLVSSSVDD